MRIEKIRLRLFAIALSLLAGAAVVQAGSAAIGAPRGLTSLTFEENRGQTVAGAAYLGRQPHYTLLLHPEKVSLRFGHPQALPLDIFLLGARADASPFGAEMLPGKVNYYRGASPANWQAGIPTYSKVGFSGVYPGIDVVYYDQAGQLEFDFVIEPNADPHAIALRLGGAEAVRIDAEGRLEVLVDGQPLRFEKPLSYQTIGGARREVASSYVLNTNGILRFDLGDYDSAQALVIDPVLSYSTLLGGSDYDDIQAVVIDDDGNVIVAGSTTSPNFPTAPGSSGPSPNGQDVFVAKLDSTGSQLLYTTFLGGANYEAALAAALDSSGAVFVAGRTDSPDFPVSGAGFGTSFGALSEAFIAKLDLNGALDFSCFLGGSGLEEAYGVAVDGHGDAWVVGGTNSQNFLGGSVTNFASHDAFLVKVASDGTAALVQNLFGGSAYDEARAIAIDGDGSILVAGGTQSSDFALVGAYDSTLGGAYDAFLVKFAADGVTSEYGSYFGGSSEDEARGIAVDPSGVAYLAGTTLSADLPTTPGAVDTSLDAARDAFLAVIDTDETSAAAQLLYSTMVGGAIQSDANSVAVDASTGRILLVGTTYSPDFPLADPLDSSLSGDNDAFVAAFQLTPPTLEFSTYLGGRGHDLGRSVAVDLDGVAHVVGRSGPRGFPTTGGALQTKQGGALDGFYSTITFESGDPGDPGDVFESEKGPRCLDGLDNDGDGLIDQDDPDCQKGKH